MPESKASKASKFALSGLIPLPRTAGAFILLTAALALTTGIFRYELILILMGAVFLGICLYSFLMCFILALAWRKKAETLSVSVRPRIIPAGKSAEISMSGGFDGKLRFRGLPAILIRYELLLSTRDGRVIRHILKLRKPSAEDLEFAVPERGAYSGQNDVLSFMDAFGFFRSALKLPRDRGPRLLAAPEAAAGLLPVYAESGGTELRQEIRRIRTDDLTDHRPYVFGDDPRRINWKLYGHAGDLFVRQGEVEPPPHSKLLILLDSSADPSLYNADEGRKAVDMLCSHALAIALDYSARGMYVRLAYTGGNIMEGAPAEMAAALAHPYALPLDAGTELPSAEEEQGVLILALPRDYANGIDAAGTALDRFLSKRRRNARVDLLFLYGKSTLGGIAEACVRVYQKREGLHVRHIQT